MLGGRGHAVIGCCSRMESRDWSWPPWDASEVSGGEVPNATMAMLRRWATKFQRRARELIGRATCQQRSLPAGRGEDRAEGHPPEWSRTLRLKKKETMPTEDAVEGLFWIVN